MSKFKIPFTPPTTNKTIRFPNDVIEKVEKAIQGKDCTFSAFVIAAVRSVLEGLEDEVASQPQANLSDSKIPYEYTDFSENSNT